ncbi:hypothetical protein CHS0354_019563 [Potamilus streckersoni]|uniref:TIR domain-containing protein n=1 Tax=Potamilus streckersoni TaxID=2493646 RepID=A0AAE0TFS3_9BIVA|nr:hypothetical protein CHS0354_019563 [Potamilus streckersoni]
MEIRFTLIINLILVVILHTSEANVTCTVNDISYICKNIAKETDFPLSLPANIRKVTLFGTDALDRSFPNGLFRSQTWANISELSILEFTDVDFVEKDFLVGLEKLIFLSISSCPDLEHIDPDVFHSTPDLEALYLDGNSYLKIYAVEAALNGKLGKLKYLSLIGIQATQRHVVLGENFTKALSTKNLTYLDISGVKTILVEQVAVVEEVLSNVKYLNVSDSTLLASYGVQIQIDSLLRNVELVDITSCKSLGQYAVESRDSIISRASFPNVKYLFAQHIAEPNIQVRLNAIFTFENYVLQDLKMLDLSNNNIIYVNLTFFGIFKSPSFEILNLANNNMEYISPSFLCSFPSLKLLDLSNNQLHKMQTMENFSYTFSYNKNLEILFLRNNSLSALPLNLFSSNTKLRIIDLSENELTYINIDLHNTWHLRLIDLRKNRIKRLPAAFLRQLDQIFLHQGSQREEKTSNANILLNQFQDKRLIAEKYRYGYNASESTKLEEKQGIIPQYLMLNVLENPLVCDCESLDFVEWILFANISIVNRTTLTCEYQNNEELLSNEFVEMVRENCRFAHILGIGIGSLAAIMISIIAFGIMIHLRRRKAHHHQNFTILKREILHDNTHFNFVVFLSYCSQDSHIVDDFILPSLNKFIKKTFNTQKDLVCTGADSFVPGMLIIEEIHRCINESLVIVPVITPAFLESRWSLKECVDAIERHRKVVVLMKEHTDISGTIGTIKHLIAQYTRATWSYNEGHFVMRPSWNTICDGIIQTASEAFRNHRRQNCNATIELVSLVKSKNTFDESPQSHSLVVE